jgi:hypothetical protein
VISSIYDGAVRGEKISRVDLFADFALEPGLEASDIHKLVTRARRRKTNYYGTRFTGFEIGQRNIRALIYDKTLQARTSGRLWFYDIWGLPEDSRERIWRVEFQFHREALKLFAVENFDDLIERCPNLWRYATTNWLSIREVGKKNPSRRPVTEYWKSVQAVNWEGQDNGEELGFKRMIVLERGSQNFINRIAGIIKAEARRRQSKPGLVLLQVFTELSQRF